MSFAIQYPETTDLMFGGFTKKESGWLTHLEQSPDASFQLLVEVIDNGQKTGVFEKGDPLKFAVAAWSLMHGFAMLITAGFLHDLASSKKQMKKLGKRLTEILMSGIQSQ